MLETMLETAFGRIRTAPYIPNFTWQSVQDLSEILDRFAPRRITHSRVPDGPDWSD